VIRPRFEPDGWHPKSRFLSLGGDTVHYVDPAGDGIPVLLLHGILVSSWAWRHNLDALVAAGFRPIAVCQKGFGWSSKHGVDGLSSLTDLVRRLADALQLERLSVVGNSLGGSVALQMALQEPGRVDRLVLVSPAVVPPRPLSPFLRLQRPRLAPLYRLAGRRAFYRWFLTTFAYRNLAIDDRYMRYFYEPLRGGEVERAAAAITRRMPDDLERLFGDLDRVRHPTLLLWGAGDRLVPLRAGHILERQLPDSRLIVFPESAHCPMEENPERFNRIVIRFLTGG